MGSESRGVASAQAREHQHAHLTGQSSLVLSRRYSVPPQAGRPRYLVLVGAIARGAWDCDRWVSTPSHGQWPASRWLRSPGQARHRPRRQDRPVRASPAQPSYDSSGICDWSSLILALTASSCWLRACAWPSRYPNSSTGSGCTTAGAGPHPTARPKPIPAPGPHGPPSRGTADRHRIPRGGTVRRLRSGGWRDCRTGALHLSWAPFHADLSHRNRASDTSLSLS